jgi:HEAT repeat protein
VTDPVIKEGVIRALSDPAGQGVAAGPLLQEYYRIVASGSDPDGMLRWAIGNALSVVAEDSVSEEVINLATDRSQGRCRQMVVVALSRLPSQKAVPVLLSLLSDREVVGHALIALRNLKAPEAIPHIESFLADPEVWIRKEAERALVATRRSSRRRR